MGQKMTKRQEALLNCYKRFDGMAESEILNSIPKVKVELFRDKRGDMRLKIKQCPLCNKSHLHTGFFINTPEYRVIHCKQLLQGLPYPMQYELILDWNYGENEKFRKAFTNMRKRRILEN